MTGYLANAVGKEMIALLQHAPCFPSKARRLIDLLEEPFAKRPRCHMYPHPTGCARQELGLPAPLMLSVEDGKYVVTSATPGTRTEDLSVHLLGNKVVNVKVRTARKDNDSSDQVVMERSIALTQLVDVSDVKCNYQDGLLRIEIPIQTPRLEEEDQKRITTLEEEATEAAKQMTEVERKLRECKSKAHAAKSGRRSAQLLVHRSVHTRRHTLAIA